jgi:hypothetical protein
MPIRRPTTRPGGTTMKKGDTLTIDGSTGQVLAGKVVALRKLLPTQRADFVELFKIPRPTALA